MRLLWATLLGLYKFVDLLDKSVAVPVPGHVSVIIKLGDVFQLDSVEIRGRMRRDDLVLGFPLFDHARYPIPYGRQHVTMRNDVGACAHRTMARDNFGIGPADGDRHTQGLEHAIRSSADIRIAPAEEVADHEYIRIAAIDH